MGDHFQSATGVAAAIASCDTLERAEAYLQSLNKPITLHSYIAGRFTAWKADDAPSVDSFEPKTGRLYARVPITQQEDLDIAIRSANDAFLSWSKTTRAHRSDCLRRIADLIRENRELLAVWESIDQGKTLERARMEVDRAVANFS